MVNKKSWKEFRDCGLLWWANMILHTMGWAITDEKIDKPTWMKFLGDVREEISRRRMGGY